MRNTIHSIQRRRTRPMKKRASAFAVIFSFASLISRVLVLVCLSALSHLLLLTSLR
jgi:hypothetical protein